ELGAQFGNHGQRLDAVAVQIDDDQRRFFVAFLAALFRDFFLALDELDLHVQLARHFLNLGQEKQVIDQAEDARRGVLALLERLQVVATLQAVMKTSAGLTGAVLAAIAVVHGADKGSVTPLAAIVPVLPVLPAALPSLTLTLALVLSVVLSVVA